MESPDCKNYIREVMNLGMQLFAPKFTSPPPCLADLDSSCPLRQSTGIDLPRAKGKSSSAADVNMLNQHFHMGHEQE
eukprot:1160143-Pelagomonas_calceolata.AAC.8